MIHETNINLITDEHKIVAKYISNRRFSYAELVQYVGYLGNGTDESTAVCEEFVKPLKPWSKNLLGSLGRLFSRFYFVGESSHIDKVLELFSESWVDGVPLNHIGEYK